MSKSLLTERLRALERRDVIERQPRSPGRGSTHHLRPSGVELAEVCFALGNWGARWLEVEPQHLGPQIVLWNMARLADLTNPPQRRLTLRFDLTDLTTSEWLAKWHMGWISLPAAQRRQVIDVVGPARLARAPGSLGRSPFAGVKPARQSAATSIDAPNRQRAATNR